MFATASEVASLRTPEGKPIPLRGVNFDVTLRDVGAYVTVAQHFQNVEENPIEAVYSFPLPEGAAICGLEVRLGERVITGKVEEKETAFAEYDQALQEGHGAYLVDEDRPNIFTISVGNLLPQQAVVIQIRYVQELDTQPDGGRFVIPTTISPRYVPLEQLQTAPASELLHINPPRVLGSLPYGLTLRITMAASSPIRSLESPSHPIRCTIDGSQATVELVGDNVQLDQDFVLIYTLQESHRPQVLLGKDQGSDGYVAMVNFWPQFESKKRQPQEFIFVIDCSGSMEGESIQQAKMALQLCLRSMQAGDCFNIYSFGSSYEKLFKRSQLYSEETLATASRYIQKLEANLGGTEIYPALKNAFSQRIRSLPTHVIVLTDGQVSNEQQVIELARQYQDQIRVFPFGIGRGVGEYLIRGLARVTRSTAEFIFPGERIEPKVLRQFARIGTPHAEQVQLDWGGLAVDLVTPETLPPLFPNQRWTAYARLNSLRPTQVRLQARVEKQNYTWDLEIDPQKVDESPLLAVLMARSAIRDLEEQPTTRKGSQQRERLQEDPVRRQKLVELACRYQLMSSATSFVAIEQRQEGDKTVEIKLRRVPIALTRGWGDRGDVVNYFRPPSHQPSGFAFAPPFPRFASSPMHLEVIASLDNWSELDQGEGGSERFSQLVLAQAFDGSWRLDEELLDAVGWNEERVQQVLAALGTDTEETRTLVATLLALHVLRQDFLDRRVEWQLLAEKAEQWLCSVKLIPPLTDPEPVDKAKRWQTWFASVVGKF